MPKPNCVAIWTDLMRAHWDSRYKPLGADMKWVKECWDDLGKLTKDVGIQAQMLRHCITRYLDTPGLKRPAAFKMWTVLGSLRLEVDEPIKELSDEEKFEL